MGAVVAEFSMSLDGFVAAPDDSVGPLFDWYGNGDVELTMPGDHPARHARMSQASADFFGRGIAGTGAIVTGRRLVDHTDGWGGAHPVGVPVVVLTHEVPTAWVDTHPDAAFTFVTGGVEAALAAAHGLAGGGNVRVTHLRYRVRR